MDGRKGPRATKIFGNIADALNILLAIGSLMLENSG